MPRKKSNIRRFSLYRGDEGAEKFTAIIDYLQDQGSPHGPELNKSETIQLALDAFYKLFLDIDRPRPYIQRLAELQGAKNNQLENIEQDLKVMKNQLNRLQYLELTNFHAITKGQEFDVQDLESIHSRMDPNQHELMARIDDVIQEDVARGQTIKHSH